MFVCTKQKRLIFPWISKVFRSCPIFVSPRFVIGLKISRHFLVQSKVKPKPWLAHTFSRAFWLPISSANFHWLTGLCLLCDWLKWLLLFCYFRHHWKPLNREIPQCCYCKYYAKQTIMERDSILNSTITTSSKRPPAFIYLKGYFWDKFDGTIGISTIKGNFDKKVRKQCNKRSFFACAVLPPKLQIQSGQVIVILARNLMIQPRINFISL